MSTLSASVEELRVNRRQWEAFTTVGHCVVIAPPGSGKTKLLTTRLAYDLRNRIPNPHGAACITLTNAATDEIRRRVDRLGVERRPNLFIGTVHAFALGRIISPFARVVGRPQLQNMSIASSEQSKQAYEQAIDDVFSPNEDTRSVRSTIEILRQRLATQEQWARSGPKIQQVAQRQQDLLRAQGLHDFLDVVALAVEMVEQHRVVRQTLTAQYPNLYVDEYQDLAPGLDRLVRALCFDYVANAELFAVGDVDQAVFGFTGTRPELLTELAEHFDVTPVLLEHNYRCGQEIIRIANLMRQGKPAILGDRLGGSVSATRCPGGFAQQCEQAAGTVSDAHARGVALHEIAIICPTNDQCEEAADVLRRVGIPAIVRGSEYRLTPVTAFIEGCAAWSTLGQERSSYRLGDLLDRWRKIIGERWQRTDDVALAKLLMAFDQCANEPANQLVSALGEVGLAEALQRLPLADDQTEVLRMSRALTVGPLRTLSVRQLAERAQKSDRVTVTTMTSSKGLEFDIVLILGIDEECVPHYLSVSDPKLIEEDRRKLYVSLTRARDQVRIFYSGFVVTKWGRRKYLGPSRFLRQIGLVQRVHPVIYDVATRR